MFLMPGFFKRMSFEFLCMPLSWLRIWVGICLIVVMLPVQAADRAQLTIADDVVVKFGTGAGLYVRDRLTTGSEVVLTSALDDKTGGQLGDEPAIAAPGDWLGVMVDSGVLPSGLTLNGLSVRYAGGNTGLPAHIQGSAGLSLSGGDYQFHKLQLTHNTTGVRITGAGSPRFNQVVLQDNQTGMQVEQGATPSMGESTISGNTSYGVRNLQPTAIVNAQGNWWGHVSGPKDPQHNSTGQGDVVSAGVDYGQFLLAEPVLACAITPVNGYVSVTRQIALQLECPQAAHYRLAEIPDNLPDQPWLDMSGVPTLTTYSVSGGAGDKMLYVEFRTAQGSVNVFSLPQPVAFAPTGPAVQFEQPEEGAVLTDDTVIVVAAADADGIRQLEILANNKRLALLSSPPYQTTWSVASMPNGPYTLTARATNVIGQVNTATRRVTVQKAVGAINPVVELSFAGVPLVANTTLTQPGVLAIHAQSPLGIARIQGFINGAQIFNQAYGNASPVTSSQFIDFAQLPNGNYVLSATVTDADGNTTILTIPFVLSLGAPPPPVITSPVDGASLSSPTLQVSGSSVAGAQVQLYLNGLAVGDAMSVGASGGFSTSMELTEGEHLLTARASNSRGQSEASKAVRITYTPSVPTVAFISPAEEATLSEDTLIEVSATDAGGIAKVELYANDQLLKTLVGAPWSTSWSLENVTDGDYTLRAVATNTIGKSAEATRAVKVEKVVPPPPPPPLPYSVRNVNITPELSFGNSSIQISGEVVNSSAAEPVASAALRMILRVQGFERRLNLVSDASGRFSYTFVPQPNDAGTYEVRIVHPDDEDYATRDAHGRFTINRLSANYSQYRLNAIRGFASSAVVNVKASVGTGATGVHWKALPADQPSGGLPPGITLEVGEPIDIAPGASAPMSIKLTGSNAAGAAGTIILKLFANESGATPRAELRLDYQLHEARPGLTPSPTALEMGVQQSKTASGQITITNKGYSPAQNVQVQLQARQGGTPPAWVSLVSSPNIGVLDIGDSTTIQINASPGTDVEDGYYQLQLRITADNDSGGSVPVTIAVVRDGQGGVRFKLVDIYTNTLDAQGKLIEGLAGARITLQNEAVTGDIRTITSNEAGIGEFVDIPPGNYRWRISARNHSDASGRVTVHAGLTANERVFLDYQVVSIEFSVTETTIQDEYDIVLEATYQTQVPAPVVLLEPLSINLPAMQQGEEFTGELTLSNYGLVRADNLKFALPTSDASYKYEFFGDMPTELPAKSRVVIPYRITSLQAVQRSQQLNMQPANEMKTLGAEFQPAVQMQDAIRQFLRTGSSPALNNSDGPAVTQAAAKAASCSSYHTQSCVTYDYECASGDIVQGSTCCSISRVTGKSCGGSSGGGIGGGGSGGWGGGGWGGGWGGGGTTIPLTPSCTPSCDGPSCRCQSGP